MPSRLLTRNSVGLQLASLFQGQYGSTYTPTGSFESIQTITVSSSNTVSLTFSTLPTSYQHLQIKLFSSTATNGSPFLKFNSDATAGNYYTHTLLGTGSAASGTAYNNNYVPYYPGTSTNFGVSIIDILDYNTTSKTKVARILGGYDANGSGVVFLQSLFWNSTNALTSISLVASDAGFNQYSVAELYGVK